MGHHWINWKKKRPHTQSAYDYYVIPHLESSLSRLPSLTKKVSRPVWRLPLVQWPSIQRPSLPKLAPPNFSLPALSLRFKMPDFGRPFRFMFQKVIQGARSFGLFLEQIGYALLTLFRWSNLVGGMKHLMRVGVFSLVLFSLGFFGVNAQAYSQIVKAWWAEAKPSLEANFLGADPILEEATPLPLSSSELPIQPPVLSAEGAEESATMVPIHLSVLPPDTRLIIPRLNKNVPVIFSDPQKLLNAQWESLEKTFQEDLKRGVIHYPGTAEPGEKGNVFITGHSSYYLWDDGRYKDVFALLHTVKVGDEIQVQHNNETHIYKVEEIKQVKNKDVSVLSQEKDEKRLTLMTCTPVGTNIRRLVVIAKEVE